MRHLGATRVQQKTQRGWPRAADVTRGRGGLRRAQDRSCCPRGLPPPAGFSNRVCVGGTPLPPAFRKFEARLFTLARGLR